MRISIKKTHLFCTVFILILSVTSYAQQNKGVIKIETNSNIDAVIAQKKQYNKSLKTTKGYRIQLFYGSEKESYKVKDEFKSSFPDIVTKIIFSSPQWKVQVGSYETRLEADKALVPIKIEFPGAIILATEIDIK